MKVLLHLLLYLSYKESKDKPLPEEEYQEYQKRLIEYPLLKDQIEYLKKDILYHRKSIESHNRQMELLLLSATNKKFIDDEN